MKSFYEGSGNLRVSTRTVILENLPKEISENTIRSTFQKYGSIDNLDIKFNKLSQTSTAILKLIEAPSSSIYTDSINILDRMIYVIPQDSIVSPFPSISDLITTDTSLMENLVSEDSFQNLKIRLDNSNKSFLVDWIELGTYYQETFYPEWSSGFQKDPNIRSKMIIDQSKAMLIVVFIMNDFVVRANIRFQYIKNTILVEELKGDSGLVLTIRNKIPPKLWFTNKRDYYASKSGRSTYQWRRMADHHYEEFLHKSEDTNPLTPPYKNMKAFNLGVHLTWQIAISFQGYADKVNKLRDLSFLYQFNVLNDPIEFINLKRHRVDPKEPVYFPSDLPFSVQYSLESIFSLNLTVYHAQSRDFIKLLRSQPPYKITRVVERIWAEEIKILNLFDYFTTEIENPVYLQHNVRTPTYNALIRKVIITPTKMVILPPIFEVTNRILRKFHKFEDRFLRVTFADENLMQLNSSAEENHYILKRIFLALYCGISLAGRSYKFLAFSSSQLREHGCWFFSDGPDLKIKDIHKFMGNFEKIHTVAKYAARMGQSFSSSRDGTKLDVRDFQIVPDIVRNGFTFSDGVGKISAFLLRKISKKLDMNVVPSAIQFRMGGFKGVLTKCPELPENMVHFRESQRKFDSDHSTLEIIRRAAYSASHLNRQLIAILSTLGVPDAEFIKLQDAMVADLHNVTININQARRCLVKYFDSFGVSSTLLKLVNSGFLATTDNYLKNCLKLICINIKSDLKQKARIHVGSGALLIGVLDETNTLEPNQIFVYCTDPMSVNFTNRIITETCIVTRNPAFHPGDIQVVQAVDNPRLHHLKNVVVFSAKGERALPSMLSGGDLDGDEFTVIWEKKLIPPTCSAPMAPLPTKPKYVEKVQISDVVRFFVEYIISDNLGQIANAHLAHSDMSPKGVWDSKCLVLAQRHSRAVDFPKSGIPADFPQELKVEQFPDFMEKTDKPQYVSQKVLGKLYRKIGTMDFEVEAGSKVDPRMLIEGYQEYVEEAIQAKLEYDAAVRSIMNQFGIGSEFEAVCGCILRHHDMVKKSSYRVREMVLNTIEHVKRDFNDRFHAEFILNKQGFVMDEDNREAILKKASAWYYVSYDSKTQELTGSTATTFAWCIAERLIDIISSVHKVKETELEQSVTFPEYTLELPNGEVEDEGIGNEIYPKVNTNINWKQFANPDTIQQLLHMSSDDDDDDDLSGNAQVESEVEALMQI